MSESTAGAGEGQGVQGQQAGVDGFQPITSQDDLNKVIGERVARERAKFADYGDLKSKAAQFDQLQEQSKTDAEKTADRIATLEAQIAASNLNATRSKVQARYGLDDEQAELFLTAADEDGLVKQAEKLASLTTSAPGNKNRAPLAGRTPSKPAGPEGEMRDFARNFFGSGD
jgi:hypothetical protein